MTDLVEFLRARIAEDEQAAEPRRGDPWGTCELDEGIHLSERRVLAECEAKRQIIELHTPGYRPAWGQGDCPVCLNALYPECTVMECTVMVGHPCDTLCLLALPYADHPDYREEWRP